MVFTETSFSKTRSKVVRGGREEDERNLMLGFSALTCPEGNDSFGGEVALCRHFCRENMTRIVRILQYFSRSFLIHVESGPISLLSWTKLERFYNGKAKSGSPERKERTWQRISHFEAPSVITRGFASAHTNGLCDKPMQDSTTDAVKRAVILIQIMNLHGDEQGRIMIPETNILKCGQEGGLVETSQQDFQQVVIMVIHIPLSNIKELRLYRRPSIVSFSVCSRRNPHTTSIHSRVGRISNSLVFDIFDWAHFLTSAPQRYAYPSLTEGQSSSL